MMRNAFAALVAIACSAGLALQFSASYGNSHHVLATMWTLARFFTIISNLALARGPGGFAALASCCGLVMALHGYR